LNLSDLKVTRIAETADYETAPSFSPDGLRIVYAAGVPGDRADHIFTIQHDGRAKAKLTDIDANDTSPRFSPDGKTIVFARDKTYN
jgi:Tol biopolymer transport system component